ncbi:MAG TPA: hypothetical protein VNM72_15350 [Blastocatellia bacterium]|nr:hypothetical protein [Blastocatellia bacterium]
MRSSNTRCRIRRLVIFAHRFSTPKGILWFTLKQANRIGQLDPATGQITLNTVSHAALSTLWAHD